MNFNVSGKYKINNLILSFQVLILFILIGYMLIFFYDRESVRNWESITTTIGLFLVIQQLICLMMMKRSIFSYEVVITAINGIFMFGQLIINTFDIDVVRAMNDSRLKFSSDLLWHTGMYVVCCFQAFFVGMIWVRERGAASYQNDRVESFQYDLDYRKAETTGYILLIISGICRIYTDLRAIGAAQSTGRYDATFEMAQTGLIDDFAWLVIPAVFMIIVGKHLDKKKGGLLCVVLMIYFLGTSVLTGIRRLQISAIIAIALFFINYYKIKITPLFLTMGAGAGIVFLNILATIRKIRAAGLVNLVTFITSTGLRNSGALNAIFDTFAEFGVSFYSNSVVMSYVPQQHFYQLGTYFIYCVLSIFPIGPILRFFPIGSLTGSANSYMGMGIGASLFADLYCNFGYFGIFATILFSYFIKNWLERTKNREGQMYYIGYYSLVFAFINLARGSIAEMARLSTWIYFIPILLVQYVRIPNLRIVLRSRQRS